MSVWLCIPGARPQTQAKPVLEAWQKQGYKIILYKNMLTPGVTPPWEIVHALADRVFEMAEYPGYAQAVNMLVTDVLSRDPQADWIVTGGDDVYPDPNHTAEEIARECSWHFLQEDYRDCGEPGTFGVMQPTGDRWGDRTGPYSERVCGSPWMGREFCRRVNQGNGPLWPEYYHMGEDEELQAVATRLGVLWQRPDLTHYHDHWGRKRGLAEDMPEFLKRANSGEEWRNYKELFERRKAAGFPGSELLP